MTFDITLWTAFVAAATGFATWLSTTGLTAYLKFKEDKRIDQAQENVQKEKEEVKEEVNLKWLIDRQDNELREYRKELKEVTEKHNDCEKNQAAVNAKLELLELRIKHQIEHKSLNPIPSILEELQK